jgi:hypothetical protein
MAAMAATGLVGVHLRLHGWPDTPGWGGCEDFVGPKSPPK